MNYIDLFAGVGGFRHGLTAAGHTCKGFVEIDKFARKSYKAIFNTEGEFEGHDITAISDDTIRGIGGIDIIAGGFPCQAFSIAGKQGGFDDTRGTLFFEIMRFASILNPKYLFLENVQNILHHNGGDTFETLLRAMAEVGYDAEWDCINSKTFVPQNRERVFIIGHLRGESTSKVFPLRENDAAINNKRIEKVGNIRQQGRSQSGDVVSINGLAPTLCSTTTQKDPLKIVIPVMEPERIEKKQNGRRFKDAGEDMFTLTTQARHGIVVAEPLYIREATSKGFTEALPGDSVNISHPNSKTRRGRVGKKIANTLMTGEEQALVTDDFKIRKLTPRECWRLQGMPDWAFERAQAVNSDSQLYKQAGNSVTVPVIEAIARQIL
ncbi:DNA cytosine methyltransferase [Listeria booriae]|uniref:DNA cytosine methyltransferase n=1 Tax=Listeria booriae TaxID=1552123 RepID=UPI00162632F3|nr:DNA cytosine methyltransferase [Listeria booriae]MBC1290599.1 DNA cytosine methyltransferase [Listeria booriae]